MRWTALGLTTLGLTSLLAAGACGGVGPAAEQVNQASASKTQASSCERLGELGPQRLDPRRQSSAVALAAAGDRTIAYIADADDKSLHTVEVGGARMLGRTPLQGTPEHVLVLADGRVAVTLRQENRIQILEPEDALGSKLSTRCKVRTAAEPVAMALTPDDGMLLVTSAWDRQLSGYDTSTMKLALQVDTPREPRAVVVADDGKRAFVSHVVGAKLSVIDLDDARGRARNIDLRVPKLNPRLNSAQQAATKGLVSDTTHRQGCQGFALAKSIQIADDHKPAVPLFDPEAPPAQAPTKAVPAVQLPKGRIFAPRVTIDRGRPEVRSNGYGEGGIARMESPIVSVVDERAERLLTRNLVASPRNRMPARGQCLLPRAAAFSPKGASLLVTCLGSDTVVEFDSRGQDPARLERRRWRVPGGPTGIALDDLKGRAVVWSQFDRAVSVIDLNAKSGSPEIIKAPALGEAEDKDVAWGRKLFHRTDDTRVSQDGRACASCHPDGREDALTWSTPVGPRQTIMLAGRLKGSAPFSWMGTHDSLKVHLDTTFQRLGGTGLSSRSDNSGDMDALIAYIKTMPHPKRAGALTKAGHAKRVARGKKLFVSEAQGCASCHVGGAGTDAKAHDLHTMASGDSAATFDTPSLKFVAGTAPYFHDGRYATLLEVLTSADDNMGHTMHLSRSDAQALEAYLGTL